MFLISTKFSLIDFTDSRCPDHLVSIRRLSDDPPHSSLTLLNLKKEYLDDTVSKNYFRSEMFSMTFFITRFSL